MRSRYSAPHFYLSLKSAKKYYYKVKAVGGDSSIKAVTSAVVSAKPVLKAPTIKVTKAKNLKSATIKWGKIKGAKNYVVYRATKENGKYKKIGTTKKVKFIDKKVKKNKTYYYKVVAKHKKSSYSSAKSAAKGVKMKK